MTKGAGECQIVAIEPRPIAIIREAVPMDKLPEAQRRLRAKLRAALPGLEAGPYGDWLTLWRPPVAGVMELAPGVLCARAFTSADLVESADLPEGRAAYLMAAGGYEGIPAAWGKLFGWCKAEGVALAGLNWEIYHEEAGAEPRTEFFALVV